MAVAGPGNMTYRSAEKADIPSMAALIGDMGWGGFIPEVTMECEIFGYESFLLVFDDHALVGLCAVFIQDDQYAYVGMVIVKQTHRRRGIARAMLKQMIPRFGKRNIILDSIPMYRSLYTSFGFVQCEDIVFIDFEIPEFYSISALPENIHKVTEECIPALMEYDRSLHTFGHRNYVEALLKNEYLSFFAKGQNGISGLLITQDSTKIALYADDPDTAQKLLKGLMASCHRTTGPQEPVTYTILIPNSKVPGMLSIMSKLGIQNQDPQLLAYRMATKGPPTGISWEKMYSFLNARNVII